MSSEKRSVLGWFLLILNLAYIGYALFTGRMEGLGEFFGWFTVSPNMPTTLNRKPLAFILGFIAHSAVALVGWTMVQRAKENTQ
jgi:zinc transporter ZupT